jgi:hypothetical protein
MFDAWKRVHLWTANSFISSKMAIPRRRDHRKLLLDRTIILRTLTLQEILVSVGGNSFNLEPIVLDTTFNAWRCRAELEIQGLSKTCYTLTYDPCALRPDETARLVRLMVVRQLPGCLGARAWSTLAGSLRERLTACRGADDGHCNHG